MHYQLSHAFQESLKAFYDSLKALLNTYPHPTFKDVEHFNNYHNNRELI